MSEVVRIENLRVAYGPTVAVDDVSLSINHGEIFGILGPNGAGKTTTVECVAGLRKPDTGRITVLDRDVATHAKELHGLVGVQLQTSELPEKLQVNEALELFASFYPDPRDPDELLRSLHLEDKHSSRYSSLSGGQRQRLSIALALIGRPQLAILDELTTGLDPGARRETWKLISDMRDQGVTVILVTHFMEEAEYLCDRVAVFNHGRLIALDTPAAIATGGGQRVSFRTERPLDLDELRGLPGISEVSTADGRIEISGGGDLVATVMRALVARGVVPIETRVEQSTLDDAFVRMTADADASED